MNNTPTPRTDKAVADSDGQWSFELRYCSRQLERELTAVTEQRDKLTEALELCRKRVVGECGFHWENTTYTYKSRDYIADVCEQALQSLNQNAKHIDRHG